MKQTDFDNLVNPGDWMFFTRHDKPFAGIIYVCPCGCGNQGVIQFRPSKNDHPSWDWDGNKDTPTLTPSIRRTSGCMWHGFFENGQWRTVT